MVEDWIVKAGALVGQVLAPLGATRPALATATFGACFRAGWIQTALHFKFLLCWVNILRTIAEFGGGRDGEMQKSTLR